MKTYMSKLEELGIEALEEEKEAIKKAIVASQIETIDKIPQFLEKFVDMIIDDSEEE